MNEGDQIGGYTLVSQLGTGGAGTVWLAEDEGGDRVALKLVHPALAADEESRRRLQREAATVNSVRSARVAHVVDIETDASQPFIATEYVEGPTLASLMNGQPLAPELIAAIAASLARTLMAVHDARIVHRDIKPSNVICSPHGPILIDFGIAMSEADEHFTRTGLVSGTAGYTAPELLRARPADDDSDWWAWSATLLSLATGRPPYGTGDVRAIIARVLTGEPDTEGLPLSFAQIIHQALSPDVNSRPEPDEVVATLVELYGFPGDVMSINQLDWSAAFANPYVSTVRPVVADEPRVVGSSSGMLAWSNNDETVQFGDSPLHPSTRLLPRPETDEWNMGSAASSIPQLGMGQTVSNTADFQSLTYPNGAPAGMYGHAVGGYVDPHAVAVPGQWTAPGSDEFDVDDLYEDLGYEADLPRIVWIFGCIIAMPLALIPMFAGVMGTATVIVLMFFMAFGGAFHRHRENRRVRAGTARSSDTAATVASSPLLLIRALVQVTFGMTIGGIVPYLVWNLYTVAHGGSGQWMRLLDIVLASDPNATLDPLVTEPIGSIGVWIVVLATIVSAWLMPTSSDLRVGTSIAVRRLLGPVWVRAIAGLLAVGVVGATWFLVTGGAL
ncbi:MAG: serine/threonine-protein kinase [Schaalia turicensis]